MQKTASLTQFNPYTMHCWKLSPFLSSDSYLGSITTISQGLKQRLSGHENDPAYARLHLKSNLNVSFSKLPVPCFCRKLEIWISSALLLITQYSQGHIHGLEEMMHGSSTAAGHRKGYHLHTDSGTVLFLNFPNIQTGRFFPAKAKIIQDLPEKNIRLKFDKDDVHNSSHIIII